MFKSVYNL